jgi:hypothetical protein
MSCGGALAFGRHAAAQSVYKTLFGANDFPPPSYPHTRFAANRRKFNYVVELSGGLQRIFAAFADKNFPL